MRRILYSLVIVAVPFTLQAQVSDTVQAGDPRVDASRLPSGIDTVGWTMTRDGAEREGPPMAMENAVVTHEGNTVFLHVMTVTTAIDTSLAAYPSLQPIRHAGRATQRVMLLDFDGSRVTGTYQPADEDASDIEATFDYQPFDSSIMDEVIAALPLEMGFRVEVPFYVYERGGIVWSTVAVTGTAQVATRDGAVEAWVVELTGWFPSSKHIAKESRQVLETNAEPAPGMKVHAYSNVVVSSD